MNTWSATKASTATRHAEYAVPAPATPPLPPPCAWMKPRSGRAARVRWARLIHKVYAVNPLECPRCGATLRVIAVINDVAAIRRNLTHLRVRDPHPEDPDHPAGDPPSATAPGIAPLPA